MFVQANLENRSIFSMKVNKYLLLGSNLRNRIGGDFIVVDGPIIEVVGSALVELFNTEKCKTTPSWPTGTLYYVSQ